jgi:hypothetical protein
MDGGRPARPQGARGLGLTDLVWDMTVRCWHRDPVQRPTMMEVVGLVREWPVLSLSPHRINIMTYFLQLPDGCCVDCGDRILRPGMANNPLHNTRDIRVNF